MQLAWGLILAIPSYIPHLVTEIVIASGKINDACFARGGDAIGEAPSKLRSRVTQITVPLQ